MKQNQKERENREIMILLSDAVKYRAKTFARPKKKKLQGQRLVLQIPEGTIHHEHNLGITVLQIAWP